jgi:hypothetical protein
LDAEPSEAANSAGLESEPRSIAQALKRPDADQWLETAEAEMKAHADNGTWEIVPLPPGVKAIGSGWLFKVKRHDGSIERYKGRLVAKGYSQHPGYDYTEVFAPTSSQAAIRLVLAISAIKGSPSSLH